METQGFLFSESRPEFAQLSEAEVWQALNKDDDSLVAAEVTRLVCCFFGRFKAYVCARGLERLPPEIMHVATRCPIERVAVAIMIGYIESETGIPARITRH